MYNFFCEVNTHSTIPLYGDYCEISPECCGKVGYFRNHKNLLSQRTKSKFFENSWLTARFNLDNIEYSCDGYSKLILNLF